MRKPLRMVWCGWMESATPSSWARSWKGRGGGRGQGRLLRKQVAWRGVIASDASKAGLGASTTPLHGATTHHRLKQRAVDDKHGEHEDAGGEPTQHEHWGGGK